MERDTVIGSRRRSGRKADRLRRRSGGGRRDDRGGTGSLRFIAYLHIFPESPRRFIKFNVFTGVAAAATPRRTASRRARSRSASSTVYTFEFPQQRSAIAPYQKLRTEHEALAFPLIIFIERTMYLDHTKRRHSGEQGDFNFTRHSFRVNRIS